ncbi:MAG: nucleoside triphosphate pyrophosphatase [candidate division KSB1 bacterium]|nr:nucleoside triphosphate pyrophosphatase [candidate division KSB1 bacterium]
MQPSMPIILASTSPYRRQLLERLRLPFEAVAPGVEETLLPDEKPAGRALRLAWMKAEALANRYPDALIIGGDQVAALGDTVLQKPGIPERNAEQLARMRGRMHRLLTAVALLHPASGRTVQFLNEARLWLRDDITDAALRAYVRADNPVNCAGGYKLESLGIALFSRIECDDWTAIIGLPLLQLVRELRAFGIHVPG